ncbi:MAG TPA: LCP family protein [Propionibacterium sp.]|nr:LCP family protein [Propionibacterium sp.]
MSTTTVPEKKPVWRRVLLASLVLVLVAGLGVGGFYAWSVNQALSGVPREDLMPDEAPLTEDPNADTTPNLGTTTEEKTADAEVTEDDTAEPTIEGGIAEPGGSLNPGRPGTGAEGSLNYLLLGTDSRGGGDRGRSDVMILAHVPPARDKVYLISFTRDMWVTIPGRGAAKINAGYAYGGVPLAVRTVENLIGTRIDHAAMINFDGFIGLTDAVGGVTINNKHATPGFPRGQITISGEQALKYVRERKNLPRGDLDRAERQRVVLEAIMGKVLSPETLANPGRFNAVVGRLGSFVTADAGLTNGEIVSTAASMRLSGRGDVVSLQAPISGFGRSRGGQAINITDWPRMRSMANAIRTGTMASYR